MVRPSPFAKLLCADVGLVLVVRDEELDLVAEHRATEVCDRHLRGDYAAWANDVGIYARHVVDIANDDLVRVGIGRRGEQSGRAERS
jgi:hypothetical protein